MAENKKQSQQQKQNIPEKKSAPATKKAVTAAPILFAKENYKWMVIGGVIVLLGMVLMSGGKSDDPNTFDPKVVYSTTRVTIAPILIILGLMVEIFAIFRKPKQEANAQ
jgi:predicted histidine transporter YuiF (NhaC family)